MTRWFVLRSGTGEALLVARVRREPDGAYPEVWNGSAWRDYPPAMGFLVDPLAADEVDQAAAEAVVRELAER